MFKPKQFIPTVAILGLAAGAAALGPSASAQDPTTCTLVFKSREKGSTFTHVRNTEGASRQSNLQGDVIAFSNPLVDDEGKVVGRDEISCVTSTGARNFKKSTVSCHGTFVLRDGTLTVQGLIEPGRATSRAAVTGGTGAYTGAQGEVVSRGSANTITLIQSAE